MLHYRKLIVILPISLCKYQVLQKVFPASAQSSRGTLSREFSSQFEFRLQRQPASNRIFNTSVAYNFCSFSLHPSPTNSKSSSVSGAESGHCQREHRDMNARSLSRSSLGSVASDVMDSLPTSSTSSEHQSPQFPKHSRSPSSMSTSMVTANPVHFSSSDHVSSAFRSMNHMRKSGLLCDVHLVAGNGGDQIKCHKIVLAATSAYFNAMFSRK